MDEQSPATGGWSRCLGAPGGAHHHRGREPFRCCLRDAGSGDELLLFGYLPPLPAPPYRKVGAVLAHADPCTGPAGIVGYQPDGRGRPQVLWAYDDRGWIHDAATVHDGQEPETVITELLAVPDVVQLQVRAAREERGEREGAAGE
ncbi:hypothetical protein GCM10010145_59370 [Streptomyces ruber]|uniref:Uncharacterized protein n=2 Tax=Streptomyces TaxID=1883 RepID=A0A918EWE4_9ACTN|nr:DUF1203 domain-containing protein [Streptomyces ruber]GGQ81908.1 hypothetical protein GCM10010145_59370 [Streptomyces ruber]